MIDVVFLLLVFFVWTSSFDEPERDLPSSFAIATEPGAARSETPSTPTTTESPIEELVLKLQQRGGDVSYRLGSTPLGSFNALKGRLRQIADLGISPRVIIDPDGDVAMADTVDALDAVRMAGFGRVHLAVSATGSDTAATSP